LSSAADTGTPGAVGWNEWLATTETATEPLAGAGRLSSGLRTIVLKLAEPLCEFMAGVCTRLPAARILKSVETRGAALRAVARKVTHDNRLPPKPAKKRGLGSLVAPTNCSEARQRRAESSPYSATPTD
jgi:hypothetical protein